MTPVMPYPAGPSHEVLVYYEGCEEPEIWHLPPGHRLRVGPIGDDQRVVKIEVWETPEYEAEKAAGWVTRERLFDQNPAHPVSEAR
jgi:hypothetical protein